MTNIRTKEKQREYNQRAYQKRRNDTEKWAKELKRARDRFAKVGHKKVKSICIVCGKKWLGTAKERKFCSQKCVSGGVHNGRWNGGRRKNSNGYILIYAPHHPNATRNFALEHRLVMEKKLGRFLSTNEEVHHKNGNKEDNRIKNLVVLSKSEHAKLHQRENHN